jgi:hypothetical protein
MVLNTLRSYRIRFGNKYGELILCHDSRDPWRRDIFPLYKANRIKQKAASLKTAAPNAPAISWLDILNALNQIREELIETFPYGNIIVERAEADDIIATICKECREVPIMIVSSDKDFQQLQAYPNVSQWSPTKKKLLNCKDPQRFLKEHTLRGDASDGVPNFLSADDSIVTEGKRQKPVSTKKIETWLELDPEDFCNDLQLSYLDRNRRMVDFAYIPQSIQDQAMEQFQTELTKEVKRGKIFPYMVRHRLTQLLSCIQEF